MKKILLFGIFIFAFLFTLNPACAEKFYIKDYKVVAEVQKNGSFIVSENIDAHFTEQAHGIVRSIPKKNDRITKVKGDNIFSVSNAGDTVNIKMGKANKLIIGDKNYKIQYKISPEKPENSFYFNIIGNEWQTDINHVSFKITMPKEFNKENVHIYSGKYENETNAKNVSYEIEGNSIIGHTSEKLDPNDAITLFISVEDGYFKKDIKLFQKLLSGFLIFIFTYFVYSIWYKYGKDDHVTPVVTFEPPKGMDVLDSEIVLNIETSVKGFVSYIVFLASKNYIKINEMGNSFELTLLKENCKNLSPREKEALDIIFDGKDRVNKSQLEKSTTFYSEVQDFLSNVNKTKNKSYEENSMNYTKYASALLWSLCVLSVTAYVATDFTDNIIGVLPCIPIFSLVYIILIVLFSKSNTMKGVLSLIVVALIGVAIKLTGVLLIFTVGNIEKFSISYDNILFLIFGIIALIVCMVCIIELPKRNRFGNRTMGKLLGLKQFIKTAEKHRLEKMIKDDPSYFYNILPYAYLLDVSDVWINQFESIFLRYPKYEGAHFTSKFFTSFTKSMTSCSVPTHQNGGIGHSSSGGGFSGGGHGGGGGSSW